MLFSTKRGIKILERDLICGGKYTLQHTDDVLYNCVPESYIILLTNVTPINSIYKNKSLLTEQK